MSALVNKTPYEAWDGKIPSLAHLSLFGCDSFMHSPKERIQNLDNTSKTCIFVWYKDGVKGHEIWNPVIRTIFYRRDVIFREDKITSENEEVKREKKLENI